MNETFYMVWSEASHETHHRHVSKASAAQEAQRLARQVGGKFYVLAAVGVAEIPPPPPVYRDLDEIPF